ncbi:MAG: hypothetical protein AAGJ87_05595 [Pseudomonadota bacterium]
MADRLKQIWSGFADVTSRRLTGSTVDNVIVERRQNWQAEDAARLPDDYSAPAQAAFDALKVRLSEQEQRANRMKRRRNAETEGRFDAPAPLTSAADFASAPDSAAELIRGLKATEDRIARPSSDYAAHMAANAGKELDSLKKRKKLLGLF